MACLRLGKSLAGVPTYYLNSCPRGRAKGDSNNGRYLGHMALASYCNGTQQWIQLSRRAIDGNDGHGVDHYDSGNLFGVGNLAQWKHMASSKACRC
jgi:hypothetical protein